jgi:hypothetical protein
VQPRQKQGFIRVNVAHTRDQSLIQKQRLQAPLRPLQHVCKIILRDLDRFGAEAIVQKCEQSLALWKDIRTAETPNIPEA